MQYAADFETTTIEPVKVWAWGITPIDNSEVFYHGDTVESFMEFIETLEKPKIYFHNAGFDCEYIISYLLNKGYTWLEDRKLLMSNCFTTLISDLNQFYCMEIKTHTGKVVKFVDSLKLIPFKIEKMAKDFGLEMQKGEIDYNRHNNDEPITVEELDYLKRDVFILKQCLQIMFEHNLHRMTLGSNALKQFKDFYTKNQYKTFFPTPSMEEDKVWRKAYKGGFTYVSEKYRGKDIGDGIVLDVNSLYPSVMYYCKMPYGEAIHGNGKYKKEQEHDLFIQELWCEFDLKPNKIPTIQLKGTLAFVPTEYLKSSNTERVHLYLTSVDMGLFFEHYNVYNVEFVQYWAWKSSDKLFRKYIDYWMEIKINATKEGNKALRTIAKLMLNNLYGKFATNPICAQRKPYLKDGVVKYETLEQEERTPLYIPVGAFVTAWARYKTITSAQKVYNRFVYADTDSLHLIGTDIPKGLEIDGVKLGAWKMEAKFEKARFLRQKCYIEQIEGQLKVTVAGLPDEGKKEVTWENFQPEAEYSGKLQKRHVVGGILLKETTYKIRI